VVRFVGEKPPKHPFRDGNRVCYLLLHLFSSAVRSVFPSKKQLEEDVCIRQASKKLGITIWTIKVSTKGPQHLSRYVFRFPRYERDDVRANQIGEAVLVMASLIGGPLVFHQGPDTVFRLPAQAVQQKRYLSHRTLRKISDARAFSQGAFGGDYDALEFSVSTPERTWELAPLLYSNERLKRAACFLKNSEDHFYVFPGEVDEVRGNPAKSADNAFGQSRMEIALQEAFKTIEALLGDPPKEDKKFFARIQTIGLDPHEPVGYGAKMPLHEAIRAINNARDKKAAHGSTISRNITYYELMEYQACARHVFWSAVEYALTKQADA